MKTKIITDSISDLSQEIADTHNIEVIPVGISFGESSYVLADQVTVAETMEWIEKNKKIIEFKGISTETYIKVFEKYVNQGMEIVCITTGSRTISNYDCACLASTHFPNTTIHVIDSKRISTGVGFMALKAAALAKKDESSNAIAIRIERIMDKIKQFGVINSVNYLEYAGLCPRLVSVGSTLLNVKYEFEVISDQDFDTQIVGNSMNKAIETHYAKVFKNLKAIDPGMIYLIHTLSDENYFSKAYKKIVDLNYFEEIIVSEAGHYATSITGRSGISVAFHLK